MNHIKHCAIYDYVCTNCGHQFEAFQKITDEPLKKCPECKKAKLVRGIGTPGIIRKGPDWPDKKY